MKQVQSTTNHAREKGKHLTFEDRVIIHTRLRDKCSLRKIARELDCYLNTVRNEMECEKVRLYNGRKTSYRANIGQDAHEAAHKSYSRHYRAFGMQCVLKHQ